MELEKKDSENCPQLTEDLLFEEILPRLDVESLIRLKLVSKRWLQLITTDSRFIRNHFRRQSQTPAELSIIVPNLSLNMYFFDHRSGTARARDVSWSGADRFRGPYYSSLKLVGSCNGLVCVALRNDRSQEDDLEASVVLWNPGTGEARDTLAPYHRDPVYGFGHDERHDDYKVVRATFAESGYDVDPEDPDYAPPPAVLNFDVFSRNSGVWRRLERSLVGHGLCGYTGHFVNGCLYWWLVHTEPLRILSFDLRNDEFRVIDTGISFDYIDLHAMQLIKWKRNCLACVRFPIRKADFKFKLGLVLDGDGNVVVDEGANRTSEALFSSGSIMSLSLYGVSHGRFFVGQVGYVGGLYSTRIVMYDSAGYCGDRDMGSQGSLLCADWEHVYGCCSEGQVHDYVPSLVSVYPDRNMTMMTEGGR